MNEHTERGLKAEPDLGEPTEHSHIREMLHQKTSGEVEECGPQGQWLVIPSWPTEESEACERAQETLQGPVVQLDCGSEGRSRHLGRARVAGEGDGSHVQV